MTCTAERLFAVAVAAVLGWTVPATAAPAAGYLTQAERALARGDKVAAELAVRRAEGAGVARERLAALAGEVALLRGDLADARRWLGPARFAEGTDVRGHRALARLRIHEGDFVGAGRAYQAALREAPRNGAVWTDVARLHYRVGQHHQALDAAETAVTLDPQNPRALELRGQLLRDARGPIAALPWFEQALARRPNDLALLGEYAATLAEAGRNRDMLAVVRRMVELDPHHPRAYFLQAVLAARGGYDDLARRLLARTGEGYRSAPAGRMLAGILELRSGDPMLAVRHFEGLLRRQPDNRPAALLLGRALLASGDAREAAARLAPLADRYDASPYLLALVGRAFEQLGDRKVAARFLDRSGERQPAVLAVLPVSAERAGEPTGNGAAAAIPQVRQLLARGRAGDARELADRARRRFPGSADMEVLAGDAALLSGDAGAAVRIYRRAAEIRRDFALVERMVTALRMLRQERTALALLADYTALNPRSPKAAALLGRILAQRGRVREGAALLSHARSLTGPADPRLTADLAAAELAAGNASAALALSGEAYARQRSNRRVARLLARGMAAQGQPAAEIRALLAKADGPPRQVALARR